MSNLATEKTKNGCFRLQFQLKLISATELIFFGFTFSFFRFECIGNRFSAKKKQPILSISVLISVLVVRCLGWILGSIGIILNAWLIIAEFNLVILHFLRLTVINSHSTEL